ncbi:shikimate dehydrogenase family protein [Microbacterium sp. YY-01]|uniref:shikimate dehydrogenase family protein n=1 Tax=Microbacterium sp. YY-01 TaxID=3421634 RepID=UPI003D17E7F2
MTTSTSPFGGSSAAQDSGYMGFVGVSTGSSSIMSVFPLWAEILGLPTRQLVGHDLPLDASPGDYRRLVEQIRDDPQHRGALVTTHKMRLYGAAHDLFDELDDFAQSCGEISSITARGSQLIGRAKDPLTAALALNDFLEDDWFAQHPKAEVLILGAGGAATALSWALADRTDAPALVTVTALDQTPLDHLRAVHDARSTPAGFIRGVVTPTPDAATDLIAPLPAGSLIVNATGLGKDAPGSPLRDDVVFARDTIVWEFNYRGSLEMYHRALAQRQEQNLVVVDGWRYFIHGWTQVIADVFDLTLTPQLVEQLAAAAETVRS